MESALADRLREIAVSGDLGASAPGSAKSKAPSDEFARIVGDLVAEVNEKQNAAEANATGLAQGEVGIMDAVVSLNEADLSLRMMMQIRDRALDAYQRVLRTL